MIPERMRRAQTQSREHFMREMAFNKETLGRTNNLLLLSGNPEELIGATGLDTVVRHIRPITSANITDALSDQYDQVVVHDIARNPDAFLRDEGAPDFEALSFLLINAGDLLRNHGQIRINTGLGSRSKTVDFEGFGTFLDMRNFANLRVIPYDIKPYKPAGLSERRFGYLLANTPDIGPEDPKKGDVILAA